MKPDHIKFSVFTKPWKDLSVDQLGIRVKSMGFDGIEFPLRSGFQVEPEDAEKGLPALSRKLSEYGIKVTSISASPDERVFSGCAEAGIPIIRVMYRVNMDDGYWKTERKIKEELNGLLPFCEKYGVKIGIQNHCDFFVCNSMGLLHIIENYDPRYIGAVWDAAHNALNGEEPELGLEIVWTHLCMVNLKNAYWYTFKGKDNGQDEQHNGWRHYYSKGKEGIASWNRIARYLKKRGYEGAVCLTAEYTEEEKVDKYILDDIAYAKSLFL